MSVYSGRAAPAESKGIRCAEFKKSAPLPRSPTEPARAAASPAPRSLHTILTGGVEPAPHARGPATRVPCPVHGPRRRRRRLQGLVRRPLRRPSESPSE